jgi:putative membrane protein
MSEAKGYFDRYQAYVSIDRSRMILRDYLATDRTSLANQNTFLAYIRTALTLFVAGITFIRFFDILIVEIIGWAFIPIGIVTFIVGLIRYIHLRRSLRLIKDPPNKPGSATIAPHASTDN